MKRSGKSEGTLAFGVDLGATRIKAGLVQGRRVLNTIVDALSPGDKGQEAIVERIAETLMRVLGGFDPALVRGAGVGVPGIIRHSQGVVVQSPNFPQWRDFALADALKRKFELLWPQNEDFLVALDNDANVVTLGEALYGAGAGAGDFVLLTLGSGVGGGLFLCGDVYRGVEGMAGEIGHMVVNPDGPKCGCGGSGCLEQYASLNALRRWVQRDNLFGEETGKALEDPHLPERLFNAAQAGDERCRVYFAEMGKWLGVGIGSLLNVLNVPLVILAGGIARAFPAFAPAMFEELRRRVYPAVLAAADVVPSKLWEDAGILGAAALVSL